MKEAKGRDVLPLGKKALLSGPAFLAPSFLRQAHRSPGLLRVSVPVHICSPDSSSPSLLSCSSRGFLIFELERRRGGVGGGPLQFSSGSVSHCSGAIPQPCACNVTHSPIMRGYPTPCIMTVPPPDSELPEKWAGTIRLHCTVPTPSHGATHKALKAIADRKAQCPLMLRPAPRPKGLPRGH